MKKNGFTLIELLVVIGILAGLMLIIIPKFSNILNTNRDKGYKEIEKRLEEKKYFVKIDDSVAEIIANSEIDKNYGARPLRRKIQELVEDRLSEEILQGNIVRDKKFVFKL